MAQSLISGNQQWVIPLDCRVALESDMHFS